MSDLRKAAAMSSTNLQSLNSPGGSSSNTASGASTPQLDRTDSVINLTKSALYGIYNDNSLLNLNQELNDSSTDLNVNDLTSHLHQHHHNLQTNGNFNSHAMSPDGSLSSSIDSTIEEESEFNTKPTISLSNTPLLFKILLLSSSAFIYNEITKHINYNHFGDNELATFPMTITNVFFFSLLEKFKVGNYIPINDEFVIILDQIFALTVQGLLMGTIHPLMDYLLPSAFSKRLLSSNPTPHHSTSYSNLFNDLLRASITFLGISYAIRNIEWSSFLQVSIIFSFLNPGLWILLDGTFSGFLSSLLVSSLACLMVYLENYTFINQYNFFNHEDILALWLWIGSFFFCGLIIFGKIGRGLFAK
ncbi:insulin-induced protein-domain-containing protein [Scheffersomyces amazonensis]|uniref:insulin-induced protein-domain-containing protein n=1 Tax=Scheffersomyces amazonensis TaxID=1078765 RepID=UPI00315D3AAA